YYGFTYYLLPSSIDNEFMGKELIELIKEANKRIRVTEESKEEFETLSEDVFYILKERSDINSFRLLFIKRENSAERIIMDLNDIYPSRLKKMYDAKYIIDKTYKQKMHDLTKNFKKEFNPSFTFAFYREFLRTSDDGSKNNDLDKMFLNLTQSIFLKYKYNPDILFMNYMRNIRRKIDTALFNVQVLKSMMGINYLINIGCIQYGKEKTMDTQFQEFFSKYDVGLNTDVKRGLILVGALVQKVLNIQYMENNSTAFIKNLKSLKMRQTDVLGLVPQCVNKMQEYKSYSKASNEIVNELSKMILTSDVNWKLTIDEINFYIAAGMTMQKEIYSILEKKEEE
ncbi:MAG: type I-B CRISPR-associated protein Cas8b/Csh1, partial [Bacilli bacterium]